MALDYLHKLPLRGLGGFSFFLRPLQGSWRFFIATYLMIIISEACSYTYTPWYKMYDMAWMAVAVLLYIWCIPMSLFNRTWRRVSHVIIYTLMAILQTVDVFCSVKFSTHLSPSMLMIAAETDTREAGEFLSTYLTDDLWTSPLLVIGIVTLLYAATSFVSIKPQMHLSEKAKGWLGCIVGLLLITSVALTLENEILFWQLVCKDTIGDMEHELTKEKKGRTYTTLHRIVFAIEANHLTNQQVDILKDSSKNAKVTGCTKRSPHILLIIGEAYCRSHSQLYGYEKPTTPRQVEMEKSGQLIRYDDVIAPWNLTSYVFKHLMTTYVYGDKGDWCDYPLFCQLFRQAGYKTTFITNEFIPNPKEQVFDMSGGFFINDPDLSKAQFDERNTQTHSFDEFLMKDYDKIATKHQNDTAWNSSPRLTIFHLIGQHFMYKQRCPKNRRIFSDKDYEYRKEMTKKEWRESCADYDNATHYNDSIISNIIHKFQDEDVLVIYMPDHGEEVHPKARPEFSGRMHSAQIDKTLALEEFSIPFWFWGSKKYIENHPDLWAEIKAARKRPFMTDALSHILLYLAGIQTPAYREELNILSPKYNANRKRIIKHQADYDEVLAR